MAKKTKIKVNADSEIPAENTVEEIEVPTEEQEEVVTLSKADYDALNSALEEAKKKEQDNLEGWQRERADFSNYKKRQRRIQTTAQANHSPLATDRLETFGKSRTLYVENLGTRRIAGFYVTRYKGSRRHKAVLERIASAQTIKNRRPRDDGTTVEILE